MGTTYRYGFKPKGHGYTKWVTKQRPSKSRNTHKGNGIIGDVVADVAARAIVGVVAPSKKGINFAETQQRLFEEDKMLTKH